jgi:hypothetical protein
MQVFSKNNKENNSNIKKIIKFILEKLIGLFILFVSGRMCYGNIDLVNSVINSISNNEILKAIGISICIAILFITEMFGFLVGFTIIIKDWLDEDI